MKSIFKFLFALTIPVFFVSCGDDEGPAMMSAEQAASKALTIVSGEVTSTELDGTSNEWDVTVTTDVGSVVDLEFDQATGEVVEIYAVEGPFNYEVNPGMGLILFSQAREIAVNELQSDDIAEWDLEQDGDGTWIYQFEIMVEGQSNTVIIDASTGTVL